MEDSAISINWKEKTPSKKLDVIASSSKEARKSISSRTSSKFGWKSFFRIFRKSNLKKICSSKNSQSEVVKKETDDNEVYLNDLNDTLAMAISLPDKVNGKDVQVSIELKAIGKQDEQESETGLKVAEETHSKTTFEGNIKIPSDTTIEQVANMPLYFINAEKSVSGTGELSNKIETVIKPLDDNLPVNVDKSMIVTNINLKVNLQNVDWKCKKSSEGEELNYIFISNDGKQSKTSLRSKTDDIVEEISQTNMIYNEQSKMIVKEILSQVIQKVETHDMSTQLSSIMECVNKEIDVQKSLLLKRGIENGSECSNSKTEILSRISEEIEEINMSNRGISHSSESSLYPSSTTTRVSTLSIAESGGSMYYLKAPTNTPNNQIPKYMIKYDDKSKIEIKKTFVTRQSEIKDSRVNKTSDKLHKSKSDVDSAKRAQNSNHMIYFDRKNKVFYQQVLHQNIRADIDKTLELLETAKNKLLNYLDNAIDLVDFTRGYKYKYPQGVSPAAVVEGMTKKQMIPQNKDTRNFKDSEQFFLGETKNEDLITLSKESLNIDRVPKLNTIQNIYNEHVPDINNINENICNGGITTKADDKFEELLKERYSVDSKPKNLTYKIVENDIQVMIRELLCESNSIKESILGNDDKQYEVTSVVNSVIDSVLEQVVPIQTLVADLDAPKIIHKPVCVNYCLIDETNHMDKTTGLLDLPKPDFGIVEKENIAFMNLTLNTNHTVPIQNQTRLPTNPPEVLRLLNKVDQEIEDKIIIPKHNFIVVDQTYIQPVKTEINTEVKMESNKMQKDKNPSSKPVATVFRSQKYGEQKSLSRISVKKLSPSKRHHILNSEDNLMQHLEKGTRFLETIYNEMCSCNYENPSNDDFLKNVNSSNENVETSKGYSVEIHRIQDNTSCERENNNDKQNLLQRKFNYKIPHGILREIQTQDIGREQNNSRNQQCLHVKASSNNDENKINIMEIQNKTNLPDLNQCEGNIAEIKENFQDLNNGMTPQETDADDLNPKDFIKIKHSIKEISISTSQNISLEQYRAGIENNINNFATSKHIPESNILDISLLKSATFLNQHNYDSKSSTKEDNCKYNKFIIGSKSLESCNITFSKRTNLKEYDPHVISINSNFDYMQNNKEISNNGAIKNNFDFKDCYISNQSVKRILSVDNNVYTKIDIPVNRKNVIAILQQSNNDSKLPTKKCKLGMKKSKTNKVSNKENTSDSDKKTTDVVTSNSNHKNKQVAVLSKERITSEKDESNINEYNAKNNQINQNNNPQEIFLLKKAAKILKQVEIEEEKHITSEEIITYDFDTQMSEQISSYSTMRREREKKFQYSSSSSEEQSRPRRRAPPTSKYVSKTASYAINNTKIEHNKYSPSNNELRGSTNHMRSSISEPSSFYSLPLSCSDYDADHEISSYALPRFRYEYESQEDLNNQNEIEFIEKNAAANLELNFLQEVLPTLEEPVECDSFETFYSPSIDSETSLEKTDSYYRRI